MIKAIKSNAELNDVLVEIERLMELQPESGSDEANRLEVLAILVQEYENNIIHNFHDDPIEAVLFRMDQQNLSPRDLIPFVGSRSKVSEILSKKRPLTLSMMRALHNGLGIPAKSLLGVQEASAITDVKINWEKFPAKEMISRGWLKPFLKHTDDTTEAVMSFFNNIKPIPISGVMYRQSNHIRSARQLDRYALAAWTTRVICVAQKNRPKGTYVKGKVDLDFMRALTRLSVFENGPTLVCQYLSEQGISVVVEPHLSKTYLDGSAIFFNNDYQSIDYPIIGLTLRHDRIDNFWFTLMHELAHICLHMDKGVNQFFDDLDIDHQGDLREDEADALASEALIPESEWKKSPASKLKSPDAVHHLALKLAIHPAIVAGRIRHKYKDYRLLNNLVGHNTIRPLFNISK